MASKKATGETKYRKTNEKAEEAMDVAESSPNHATNGSLVIEMTDTFSTGLNDRFRLQGDTHCALAGSSHADPIITLVTDGVTRIVSIK